VTGGREPGLGPCAAARSGENAVRPVLAGLVGERPRVRGGDGRRFCAEAQLGGSGIERAVRKMRKRRPARWGSTAGWMAASEAMEQRWPCSENGERIAIASTGTRLENTWRPAPRVDALLVGLVTR
jgi:hypothetical protein